MNNEIIIRKAISSDAEILAGLIEDYIKFYGATSPPREVLINHIHLLCRDENIGCFFLAVENNEIVGFATLYKLYSTFQAKQALMMNDFYIIPTYRKKGIGSALLLKCKEYYLRGNYAYMEWMTDPNNEQAIKVYLKNNAEKAKWQVFNF